MGCRSGQSIAVVVSVEIMVDVFCNVQVDDLIEIRIVLKLDAFIAREDIVVVVAVVIFLLVVDVDENMLSHFQYTINVKK